MDPRNFKADFKVVEVACGWKPGHPTAYVCSGIYIKSVIIVFTCLSQDFSHAPICICNLLLIQPCGRLDPNRKLDFDWRFRRSLGMHHRASCTPMENVNMPLRLMVDVDRPKHGWEFRVSR